MKKGYKICIEANKNENFLKENNVSMFIGEVTKEIKLLPENNVDCMVTSPPFLNFYQRIVMKRYSRLN